MTKEEIDLTQKATCYDGYRGLREWINLNRSFCRHRVLANWAGVGEILDIGCWKRQNLYFSRDAVVTGFDILSSPQAGRLYDDFVQGDLNDVDKIFDKKFDCVVMGEVIEHVERPYDILRKVHRVIKPNGRLVLSTPNPCGFPAFLAEWLSSKYFLHPDHKYYFAPRWVRKMMTACGFRVVKTKGIGLMIGRGYAIPAPASVSFSVVYMGIKE